MKPFNLKLLPITTLDQLKRAKACQTGYRKLYKGLGGVRAYGKTTPITYLRILEINGFDDCIWALSRGDEKAVLILRWWAVLCAERAVGIYEKQVPNDPRIRDCIETAKRFLRGQASTAAWNAARAAAWDAEAAAWNAARAAAGDAVAARAAARAAEAAAWNAEAAAGDAEGAAWAAAGDAAWAAAGDAEREWQINLLKEFLS